MAESRSTGAQAATSETKGEKLSRLGSELQSALAAYQEQLAGDHESHHERDIIKTAHQIIGIVSGPYDRVRESSIVLCELAAMRAFLDWRLLERIPLDGSISYGELASMADVSVDLITRFGRMLVSTGMLRQVAEGRVAHTERSELFSTFNSFTALLRIQVDIHLRGMLGQPQYFKEFGPTEPTGHTHTPVAYGFGHPELTVWEVLSMDESLMRVFMQAMATDNESKGIAAMYDFSWLVDKAKEEPTRPVFVDIGGGKGQSIKFLKRAYPSLPLEQCVLQDLQSVVSHVGQESDPELQGVQLVGIDFLKDQPTSGALVYWIRRCLHDWSDASCKEILSHIAKAMASDSKLLIVEQVLEETPDRFSQYLDIIMMNIAGKERTLEQFRSMVQEVGLQIVGVHRMEGSTTAAVECVKISE